MLPDLRLIFGGLAAALIALLTGFFLAATTRTYVTSAGALSPRGSLVTPGPHPEWRQFMVHGAVRRANELNQLRELSGSHDIRTATLPGNGGDAAPDDETGTIPESPKVEIGEASSTELPVGERKPHVVVKPQSEPSARKPRPPHRVFRRPSPPPVGQTNPFALLFSGANSPSNWSPSMPTP